MGKVIEHKKESDNALTEQEWNQVLQTMASAPLQNLEHAKQVDQLVSKVAAYARDVLGQYGVEPPEGA